MEKNKNTIKAAPLIGKDIKATSVLKKARPVIPKNTNTKNANNSIKERLGISEAELSDLRESGRRYIREISGKREELRLEAGDRFEETLKRNKEEYRKNNKAKIKKIYKYMPVPNDYCVVWADINSFGGDPSGVVIAEEGIVIKGKKKKGKKEKGKKRELHEGVYQIIPWEYYEPGTISVRKTSNKDSFKLTAYLGEERIVDLSNSGLSKILDAHDRQVEKEIANASVFTSIEIADLENTVFNSEYGIGTYNAGHGIYAEEAGAKLDTLHGEKAVVVGRDNAKDGPDKIIHPKNVGRGIPVQCKYYKSAKGSVDACFRKNAETGEFTYRYFQLDGKTPMMVEVPKDQYDDAIVRMRNRIQNGDVPGVKDPNLAAAMVRKGRLTYKQARNLAKAGTIESLSYDAVTGIVQCSSIAGLSAIAVFSITLWQTRDKKKAASAALETGLQVFGPAFVGRILAAQIARTTLANSLIPISNEITHMLSPKVVQSIINSFRQLAGKQNIYGAAAQKSFAKALRTQAIVSIIIFGVTSIPDTYRVITGKITGAQFTKNITSAVAAAGGAVGGGIAAGKLVAKAPIPDPAVKVAGVAGGFVGGVVFGQAAKKLGSTIKEDDIVVNLRMMNGVIGTMCIDYLLSEDEVDNLVQMLNKHETQLNKLLKGLTGEEKQSQKVEKYMEPYFRKIVSKRTPVKDVDEAEMFFGIDNILVSIAKEAV